MSVKFISITQFELKLTNETFAANNKYKIISLLLMLYYKTR
jgi:hypothetical protein